MTAPKPHQQRAELEEQKKRTDAAAAQARNGTAATEQRGVELDRKLAKLRERGARYGVDDAWREQFAAVTDQRRANAAEAAEHAANLEAAADAQRRVQVELDLLLVDHLDTFCHAAAALSEAAKRQFAALVPAISEAVGASQKAQREWAYLANALRTVLRERDEAQGTYRDAGYYSALVKFPPFPIRVAADPNWTATPPGAALVAVKPKRKVAA